MALSLASLLTASTASQPPERERSFADYMAEQEALDKANTEAASSGMDTGHGEADENDEAASNAPPTPRIKLYRGASRASVRSADDIDEQVERLDAWEEQLQAYSDQLTEQGWTLWKRGAVNSVMGQLQRQVVPDQWKNEVARLEASESALRDQLKVASEKERALLTRLDEVENGPGCAREVREKLEEAELNLERQQARERQQSVFKQMLSSGSVSNNLGGAAPAMRRRATVATTTGDDAKQAAVEQQGEADADGRPLMARNKSAPAAAHAAAAQGLRRRATSCGSIPEDAHEDAVRSTSSSAAGEAADDEAEGEVADEEDGELSEQVPTPRMAFRRPSDRLLTTF